MNPVPGRRLSGALPAPAGAGAGDHACWGYIGRAERAAAAVSWLGEGLGLGERGVYIADLPREELLDDLQGLPGRDDALAAGALVVLPSEEVYDLSAPIDATVQLAAYSAAVDGALADGLRGLRVAADITPLVADESRRPAHLHWEQVADRYMTANPLAPLCLYDRSTSSGIDAIICAHPLQGPTSAAFGLYAVAPTEAVLEGELDAMVARVLHDVLEASPVGDDLLDLSGVSFIDVRSAGVLNDALVRRRTDRRSFVATGASPLLRRVWSVCGYDDTFFAA